MSGEGWFDDIGYMQTILLTGFFKSTVGTTLISLGIGIGIYSFVQGGFHPATPFIGIILFLTGIIVYFFGDIYKNEKKKEEGRVIKSKTEELVEAEATRIAQAIVDKAEAEKLEKINQKFKQVENGICNDLRIVTKDGRELPYCGGVLKGAEMGTVPYPDIFPADEIVHVAEIKLRGYGKEVTRDNMEQNVVALLANGLISREKCEEALSLIYDNYLV